MFYGNVTWDGNIKIKIGRYTNCNHYIAVELILKHKQKGLRFGRVSYIIRGEGI
jgi:hypothetical protein